MEIITTLFPILIGISKLTALVAILFLISRARGAARLLIMLGVVSFVISPFLINGVKIEERTIAQTLLAAGAANIGTLLLSVGVILFTASLPSKRLQMSPDDKRVLSDQIIEATLKPED